MSLNRREFLCRSLLAAIVALPLARTLLRRWVFVFREGDLVPDFVQRTQPYVPGHFGVDAVVVRAPRVTYVWPLAPIPVGRAICEWPAVNYTSFLGAPTHWYTQSLLGDPRSGYAMSIGCLT